MEFEIYKLKQNFNELFTRKQIIENWLMYKSFISNNNDYIYKTLLNNIKKEMLLIQIKWNELNKT